MGYYSDEFFKEYGLTDSDDYKDDFEYDDGSAKPRERDYQDVYSDSRRRSDLRRSGSRNARSPYDRDGDYRDRPQRSTNRRNVQNFDRDGNYDDRRRRPPQGSSQRQPQRKHKRRKSRLFRRTMIVLSFAAILLVLIGIIAAIASSFGVGEVQKLASSEVGSDKVVLSWEKASHATGYKVLASKDGAEFREVQTIDSPDTLTATVGDLEQASSYSFSVVALRDKKEGKPVTLEKITTLPTSPEITNSFSTKPGVMHLDWSENAKASGYIVEYKKDGGEYSADTTLTVSGSTECKADIEGLEVNATYLARVTAFIDGDKRTYVETYEMVLPLMSKGGWILADNTLWDGHVIDPEYARDYQTKGIRDFNDVVANDDRVEKVMIPLRDGLTLIRKK